MASNADILALLGKTGGFASGEALSRRLGISRAALWKRIESLRKKGFGIESSPGRGYRLVSAPDISLEGLEALLPGRQIEYLDVTSSTNEVAMGLASGGARKGTLVIADRQTGGRGRLGRRWHSPAGRNIYMSLVLRPDIPPSQATLLTLASAVAAATAVNRAVKVGAGIKWPNDIIASGRKIGGILLEMRSETDRISHAVVGIGVNVNMKATELPPELKPIATSLMIETGQRHGRARLAAAIVREVEAEVRGIEKRGGVELIDKWRALSTTLGRRVEVNTPSGVVRGVARDIDEAGRLLVDTGRGTSVIASGDVVLP